MNPLELLYMSLRTVTANPMRTMLTMLGVIIGVSSVVTLVAIGQGANAQIEKQYESLGTWLRVVPTSNMTAYRKNIQWSEPTTATSL
jgi:putative ABC transport system permease protein